MITLPPKKIKIELMSNEIQNIIEELERAPHDVFVLLDYDNLIEKLKRSLK